MCRRIMAVLLTLLFIPMIAFAETWYVSTPDGKTLNLRSEANNAVIGHIPNGTALVPDEAKSTETAAYVTYKGTSGYVKWTYLSRTAPQGKKSTASPTAVPVAQPISTPAPSQVAPGALDTGEHSIRTIGAMIQFATDAGKATGDFYDLISYDGAANIYVSASIPKGKKLDYWVINGVRYEFTSLPSKFAVLNVTENMVFEAVLKNSAAYTVLTPMEIQAARTNEQLLVRTIHAQLCHMKNEKTGAGGWIESFDFTYDYVNRATKGMETGGRVTIKVNAKVPSGRKITGWKFNDMEFRFGATVKTFIVRELNVPMVYEPLFGKAAAPAPPAVNPPTTPVPVVTVVPNQNINITPTNNGPWILTPIK